MGDADNDEGDWAVVVPPAEPLVAESLWNEWHGRYGPFDDDEVRVDLIRATPAPLRRYCVRMERTLASSQTLADMLTERCPNTGPIVQEHLTDFDGEILACLLVADIRRFCEMCFDRGHDKDLDICLDVLNRCIDSGDASVQNAIAACFVEDSCWYLDERKPFVARWPSALTSEAIRQGMVEDGRPSP